MTTPHLLRDIPDADLLVQLKTLVGRSNQLTATVLAHLAEVEARGIYRDLACSSLYAYCVYELRMSEDAAQRRIIAARAVRRFPVLLEMIETAAIHLTGIVLLAPHLTEENHERLLAAARYRSKREIQKLVATVAPRPDIPARVEPLAPQPRPGRATWAAFLESLSGGVRDLPCGTGPGEAPWVGPADRVALSAVGRDVRCSAGESHAPAQVDVVGTGDGTGAGGRTSCAVDRDAAWPAGGSHAPARVDVDGTGDDTGGGAGTGDGMRCDADRDPSWPAGKSPAPAQVDAGHPVPDLRYKVQFTASEHYVRLLEEARDLLQHKVPDRDIARVHELAMEALVANLRKRRGAPATRPTEICGGEREESVDVAAGAGAAAARRQPEKLVTAMAGGGGAAAPPQPAEIVNAAGAHRPDRAPQTASVARDAGAGSAAMQSDGGARSRYVAAAVECAVWRRDEWQCTFVDDRGQRCRARSGLEIHHREAHWRGGAQTVENLTLYCRAHNQLMAERELGRQYVRARIEARRSGGGAPP